MIREREKEILVPTTVYTRPGKENSEKNTKKLINHFPALFLAKTGSDRPRKIEKKILVPNSVHTRPGQENSEKKYQKY